MLIASYDPVTMDTLSSDVTGVDYGAVIKGYHTANVAVIKPTLGGGESNFLKLALFLENNNGLNHTVFGKFKSLRPITGITPGSNYLSDYFIQVTGISDPSQIDVNSGIGLVFNATTPEYAWLDAQVGRSETATGSTNVNFRFVFEYN